LSAGDYLLVIVKETTGNPYMLEVYSATPIEVLDYASTVTAPSSVYKGTDLSITTQLTGAGAGSRIYGAVMIQKTKYSVNLALTSDGTTLGTELTGRGVVLIEGTADGFSIAGVGLSGIDKDELISKLNEAYNGDEFSVAFSDYTANTQQTVKLTTTSLNTGTYVVLVGVWEGSGDKLVAFHQREVTVSAPYVPPPSGPGPTPPAPSISSLIQAMGDVEAATALMVMSPATAAGIMSQITAQKAASIMSMMPTANAVAIVNEMQAQAAAAVMNVAENGVVVRVLATMDPAKAAAILGEMTVDKVARVLEEAVNAGKVAQFSAYMNMLDKSRAAEILLEISPEAGAKIVEGMAQDNLQEAAKRIEAAVKLSLGETDPAKAQEILNKIAKILDNTDTQALVDIFVEIANLPETPSTVADVLQVMNMTKVLDVITAWVGTEKLEDLAEVFSYIPEAFLEDVWMGMTSEERNTL
jgi:flagellar motility protein MotE (MotC chaperone)